MGPDDYARWGLWWRRTAGWAAAALLAVAVFAVGYLLAYLLVPAP
jgi:hypothetical protein